MGLHVGGRSPVTWAITATSLGVRWQEAGVRSQGSVLNPGTQMWAAGILTSLLLTRPNACPETLLSQVLGVVSAFLIGL